MNEPTFQKKILNANLNTDNIVHEKELHVLMKDTLKYIQDVISNHFGPYSKFAILTDITNPLSNPTFSKDGINILRSIEFASPLQEFIKRTICYVGSRVESKAGDGTTTAALMVSGILLGLLNSSVTKHYTFYELTESYKEFFYALSLELKRMRVTPETLTNTELINHRDAIKFIAFNQAYTSSHGNTELAWDIAKIFTELPENAWDHICYQREALETDTTVSVYWDENQYTLEANIFDNKMLNTKANTAFKQEDCTFVLATGDLLANGQLSFNTLNLLKEMVEKEVKNIVLLCPSNISENIRHDLKTIIKNKKNSNITIFTHYTTKNYRVPDLDGIALVAGCPSIEMIRQQEKPLIFEHVNVEFTDIHLKLNNLYENKNNSITHPHIKTGGLGEVLKYLENNIKQMKNEVQSKHTNDDLIETQKFYNKLHLSKRAIVKIGGSAYDNAASVDVIMDVINSVKTSLKDGFVLPNGITLHKALKDVIKTCNSDVIKEIAYISMKCIQECNRTLLQQFSYFTTNELSEIYTVNHIYNFTNIKKNPAIKIKDMNDFIVTELEKFKKDKSHYIGISIQPVVLDKEIFKRLGEVGLRIIYTNMLISTNSVYLKDNKKDKPDD